MLNRAPADTRPVGSAGVVFVVGDVGCQRARDLPSQAEEECATQSICAGWRYRTFVFREIRLPNAALILVVDPARSANSRRRFGNAASATAEAAV